MEATNSTTTRPPTRSGWTEIYLAALDAAEGNAARAARRTPISPSTVRKRRRTDPEFASAVRQVLARHRDPRRPWASSRGSWVAQRRGGAVGARRTAARRRREVAP